MRRPLLVVVIVASLAIISVIVYLAKPRTEEVENPTSVPVAGTESAAGAVAPPSGLASCVGPADSQVLPGNLAARHQWATSLLKNNHFEGAVTELRNIATLDPGYPGINLDLANALLKTGRASDAKDSIKLQLEISECLSKLPQSELANYCKSAWAAEPRNGCIPEIDAINQKAHYQAGVIDNQLARNVEPLPEARLAASESPRVAARPVMSSAPSTAAVVPLATPRIAAADVPAAPTAPPLPPIKIKTTEAAQHIGELATVCGPIIGKHTADQSNGKPTFINFDRPFPDPGFTALIWATDSPAVGEFPETGNACVTGTITTYHGNPEIIVHDAKSWQVSAE